MSGLNQLALANRLVKLASNLLQEDMGPSKLDGMTKVAAKNLVNKTMASPPGLFRDTDWAPVQAIFKRISDAGIVYVISTTEYGKDQATGTPNSKTWKVVFPFKNEKGKVTELYGMIMASGAGTVDDPLSVYDLTAYAN